MIENIPMTNELTTGEKEMMNLLKHFNNTIIQWNSMESFINDYLSPSNRNNLQAIIKSLKDKGFIITGENKSITLTQSGREFN
jgi:predicted transcriptional regulator